MDIVLAGGAVTYEPNDDQLGRVSLEFAAFDGEVGVGQLPVPDSAAALTVENGRAARVNEIATRLTDGFILDQDRLRGPQPAGTAREHTFSVQDANVLLDGFRIRRTRTAETDYARVLAFAALDGPTWDTTWVLNVNTVTMNAKTYDSDGGWTSELIPDLVDFTGKTLFLHDKAGGGRCLHYHNLTSGHTCGLTISDVPSAVNGVTVFAPGSPTRNRTSVDLRNDIKGRDQSGRVSTQTDTTSIASHDADGLQHQSLVDMDASSQSDLNVKVAAYLASFKDDLDTWTCAIGPLDATALSLIRVGDLITTTSSVMGLTASPQRIAHMTLTVWADGNAPGLWQAQLELGAPIRRRARVTNKAITDRTTHPPVGDPFPTTGGCQQVAGSGWTVEQNLEDGMTVTNDGSARIVIVPSNDPTEKPGWGAIKPQYHDGSAIVQRTIATRAEMDASTNVHVRGQVYWPVISTDSVNGPWAAEGDGWNEWLMTVVAMDGVSFATKLIITSGATDVGGVYGSLDGPGSPIAFNGIGVGGWWNLHMNIGISTSTINFWQTGPEPTTPMLSGSTLSGGVDAIRVTFGVHQEGTNGTYPHYGPPPPQLLVEGEYVAEVAGVTVCTGTEMAVGFHGLPYGPVAAQEPPNGARVDFTIPAYPGGGYVSGTLTVWVDGVQQNFTETDPAAGTFALSWAPDTGDIITVSWLVP